ncbi:DUF4301 family protein [Putridiphycobacter roseus]|uniref:DUF4301 family protein n=1 Tax=Putridiphycobacter roseus TaxID=2219161 RepID=UPI0013148CEC|nr:DUF4301 family protein [Putridiphycobacter roseus]
MEEQIQAQLNKITAGNPTIELVRPCRMEDGILSFDSNDTLQLIPFFDKEKEKLDITFFIPASGSGSRMFDTMFDYLNNTKDYKPDTIKTVEKFLNSIHEFAFFNKIPINYKKEIKLGTVNIRDLVESIVLDKHLNLGGLPKGLIPFHRYGKFIITPFQEHIIQGSKVAGDNANFHFTINPQFKGEIEETIQILRAITGIEFNYFFSEQNEKTHAFAFDKNNHPVKFKDGAYLKRPAGHGALIHNLNEIDSDIVFIKNIDNIQHYSKAKNSIQTQKILGGKLIQFQQKVFAIVRELLKENNDYLKSIEAINAEYKLGLSKEDLGNKTFLIHYFNRPIRICGMVKNEGQPGGGPFWVRDKDGITSKQIIEKSQIDKNTEQLNISLHATHFNPVYLVCGLKNHKNEKYDLHQFKNENHYFLVQKKNKGKSIKYIEEPGLWNGAMYNWLTLFYEIDSNCFSPVKTIMDLLHPLHVEDKN